METAVPVQEQRRGVLVVKGFRMGRVYDAIDASLQRWLSKQPMFFVAAAPDGADRHINLLAESAYRNASTRAQISCGRVPQQPPMIWNPSSVQRRAWATNASVDGTVDQSHS